MWRALELDPDDHIAREQLLAFVDEYCRGMTLRDVREWYADALEGDVEGGLLS